jgi:hypothetical protein
MGTQASAGVSSGGAVGGGGNSAEEEWVDFA